MIKFNDLSRMMLSNNRQIEKEVNRVFSSGWFILGPETRKFEESFASYVGTDFAVGVANGTDALKLALTAIEIHQGDPVVVAANAGMYSTNAVLSLGALPLFVDVDLRSNSIPLANVKLAVDQGAKAVIITHLYGLANPDIQLIASFCKDRGIPLIEDCAQAHGAILSGKMVGSFGDLSTFSFYPTKNLGALGDGGAVLTSSEETYKRLLSLRQYGWDTKYSVTLDRGMNSRLDEVQSAILSYFLPLLDASNERRREIARKYISGIMHSGITLPEMPDSGNVVHLFVIRAEQRSKLQSYLHKLGIQTEVHYPIPDYRQEILLDQYSGIVLSGTETLSTQVLSLPCYPELLDSEVEEVIRAINNWTE